MSNYGCRAARLQDMPMLADIEREAAQAFLPYRHITGLNAEQLQDTVAPDELRRAQAEGLLWLIVDAGDAPVGFVCLRLHTKTLHVQEIDIHPAHARRGLGKRLLDRAGEMARAQGCDALTLTTYRDIPWNAPYYARLGFQALEPADWTPDLRAVFERERAQGWRIASRVAMRLHLG